MKSLQVMRKITTILNAAMLFAADRMTPLAPFASLTALTTRHTRHIKGWASQC